MSEKDEVYKLTPKGLLMAYLDERNANKAFDALELYCRRNNVGIAIEDNSLRFVELVKDERVTE